MHFTKGVLDVLQEFHCLKEVVCHSKKGYLYIYTCLEKIFGKSELLLETNRALHIKAFYMFREEWFAVLCEENIAALAEALSLEKNVSFKECYTVGKGFGTLHLETI